MVLEGKTESRENVLREAFGNDLEGSSPVEMPQFVFFFSLQVLILSIQRGLLGLRAFAYTCSSVWNSFSCCPPFPPLTQLTYFFRQIIVIVSIIIIAIIQKHILITFQMLFSGQWFHLLSSLILTRVLYGRYYYYPIF